MTAYYNEIDPKAAAWLRELIKRDLIAPGDVDERSIVDVKPEELKKYTQCHFFAGIGVWSYALRRAGWPDDRQVWTGSCPCQPFSSAGKGKGVDDERHLWPAFHWLIRQCRPGVVFGEQVAAKAGETWFDIVSTDMEGEDYTVGASVTAACGFGAPHKRKRLFWVGHTKRTGLEGHTWFATPFKKSRREQEVTDRSYPAPGVCNGHWSDFQFSEGNGWIKPIQPGTFPLVDGPPARVGRLRGYGNALVAPQAQAFVEAYMEVSL